MQPLVSIIIPVRNASAHLRQCLESIRALAYPQDRLEVIVADGKSDDGSAGIAREFGAVVVENECRTITEGRNAAFARARGDIIAFCDADCRVDPLWIRNALPFLEDVATGGVGGPIELPDHGALADAINCFFQLGVAVAGTAHADRVRRVISVPHIPTCNLLCKKTVLDEVFPIAWNTGYGSDLELSRRILLRGRRLLLVPGVRVWHRKRTSLQSFANQMFLYGRGRFCIACVNIAWLRLCDALAALAVPLLLIGLLTLALRPAWLSPVAAVVLAGMAAYALWVLQRTRLVTASLLAPAVLITGILSWSAGFLGACMTVRRPSRIAIRKTRKSTPLMS
jgi:glycosyltransferase involved in cell wall biosynthesis